MPSGIEQGSFYLVLPRLSAAAINEFRVCLSLKDISTTPGYTGSLSVQDISTSDVILSR